MSRPELPPETISKYTPTFQFPKSLLQPIVRPLVRLQDSGWLPATPLRQHLVICGFPRSGTTLCQLMIEACASGIKTFGRERRALEAAKFGRRTHADLLTKRPKDIFLIPEIRTFYASHPADVRFVLMHRDPRAVLTSKHFSRPGQYFVSASQWRHIYQHWKWSLDSSDVLSVSYEDLVCAPDRVELQIGELTRWKIERSFRDFHRSVPAGFDGRALNGVRALDEDNRHRWRDEQHRSRIESLLRELPELPEILIELGYEPDDSWVSDFSSPSNSGALSNHRFRGEFISRGALAHG